VNTTFSNSSTKTPLETYPKFPPSFLEPGSVEYFFAASPKSKPSRISFLIFNVFSKALF